MNVTGSSKTAHCRGLYVFSFSDPLSLSEPLLRTNNEIGGEIYDLDEVMLTH